MFPISRNKWEPDNKHSKCQSCKIKFSRGFFKSGKHHCRKCGSVICTKCSKYRLRKQIVCKNCYNDYRRYENVFTQTLISNTTTIIPYKYNQHKDKHNLNDGDNTDYEYDNSSSDEMDADMVDTQIVTHIDASMSGSESSLILYDASQRYT